MKGNITVLIEGPLFLLIQSKKKGAFPSLFPPQLPPGLSKMGIEIDTIENEKRVKRIIVNFFKLFLFEIKF